MEVYDELQEALKEIERLNNKINEAIKLLIEKENKKDDTALFNNIAKAIQILGDINEGNRFIK